MKIREPFLLLVSLLTFANLSYGGDAKLRIACVGNSITFGAGVVDRERNCYPAQLQAILGDRYDVRNFGKNGATVSTDGDIPFLQQPEFRDALKFVPDIVLCELGTNDSKPQYRQNLSRFERDYEDLIRSFQQLPTKPRIVLLLPPPSFSTDTTGISNTAIRDSIIPRIQSIGYATGLEVVQLYSLLVDRSAFFPDQIHPSSIAAGLISNRLYEVLKLDEVPGFDIVARGSLEGIKSNYYGFDCYDFVFERKNAKIVKPKKTAKGCPWLWRARFWGHEPQTEIALLERGFHVVYCDVAELFGNDEAVTIWNEFYDMLTRAGLSAKPALEGFSRGGVYMYRWASVNPDRVACIYADAPVLDLKSWPGAKGKGHGNPELWEMFKRDFGLKTEEEALAFRGNPLDMAAKIAQAGFPMLHVCGTADETVPIEENTGPFEQKILASGGNITVIRKPGVGHNPHSLPNPQPIVDFILRATGQKTNFACIPAPGNEYRPGAGWNPGMDWHSVFEEMNQIGETRIATEVLFFGNSITQGIGGKGRSLAHAPGDSAFSSTFGSFRWLNFGISGDRTQHVLWRVIRGNWQNLKPRLIVLAIGVNNFPDDTGEEVAEGIVSILHAIAAKDGNVKVLIAGPLPAKEPDSPFRKKFEALHKIISRLANQRSVFYSGLPYKMLNPDQTLNASFFSPDGVHLTARGYQELARLLAAEIRRSELLE
jgi:lysophospholipase L1-like esterase/pimeloyl-ACP methyl ester carboxylesterase